MQNYINKIVCCNQKKLTISVIRPQQLTNLTLKGYPLVFFLITLIVFASTFSSDGAQSSAGAASSHLSRYEAISTLSSSATTLGDPKYLSIASVSQAQPNTPNSAASTVSVPSVLPGLDIVTSGIIGNRNILNATLSKILDILSSKCILGKLTGGSSSIKKVGTLIIGTVCDDVIFGTNGNDIIYTRAGNDVVYARNADDIIYGGIGDDRIYGGGGNDLIIPGPGSNLEDGGAGDDVILGGLGNDLLVGGTGNDKLFAGPGSTVMFGGPGANHFDCPLSVLGLARGVVMDYNPANGDTISGSCKIVNTIGNSNTGGIPQMSLPDTEDTSSSGSDSSSSSGILGQVIPGLP
jgi:Ca2+-binding RTX toxin-like protein